jgi:phage shock protein PspC (stress-responsive transcriptional regulator)
MKKTLTVNLGGIVFNIDDDAFVILKKYLDTIKGYFDYSDGRDEIMTDIESRIAEMLQEKMHGGKEVVNATDINAVITTMGQPEDYITEDMDDEPRTSENRQNNQQNNQHSSEGRTYAKRRLYRDQDENMIGGVASGIGYYFGIDPLWIRLLLVVAVFLGFSGVLIYIILWIIMPEARTSAEKLAMKGEPVTFDNIGKTVEEELKNVKKKLNNLDGNNVKRHADNVHSAASHVGEFILSIFKFAFKAIGKILGFFFIMIGGLVLITFIIGIFSPTNNMFFSSNGVEVGYNLRELSNLIFLSGTDFWLSMTGSVLLIGIPFLALLLAGITLLFNAKIPKYTGLALAGAWVLGIILSSIGGLRTGMDFTKDSSVSEVIALNHIQNDTLYFDILDHQDLVKNPNRRHAFNEFFELRKGVLTTDGIGVNILKSKTSYPEIEVIKSASGKSFEDADKRASTINFELDIDSNNINIAPYFKFDVTDKWRAQEVMVNLYIPVGKTIFIPRSYKYLLDDVKNYHDTYDGNMVDLYWTMTDSGLVSPEIMRREQLDHIEYIKIKELKDLEKLKDLEDLESIDVTITEDGEEHHIIIN